MKLNNNINNKDNNKFKKIDILNTDTDLAIDFSESSQEKERENRKEE